MSLDSRLFYFLRLWELVISLPWSVGVPNVPGQSMLLLSGSVGVPNVPGQSMLLLSGSVEAPNVPGQSVILLSSSLGARDFTSLVCGRS